MDSLTPAASRPSPRVGDLVSAVTLSLILPRLRERVLLRWLLSSPFALRECSDLPSNDPSIRQIQGAHSSAREGSGGNDRVGAEADRVCVQPTKSGTDGRVKGNVLAMLPASCNRYLETHSPRCCCCRPRSTPVAFSLAVQRQMLVTEARLVRACPSPSLVFRWSWRLWDERQIRLLSPVRLRSRA